MGLRSFHSDHPVAAPIALMLVISVLGVVAVITATGFFQGTLFGGDAGCEWSPVEVEETGQTFTSIDEVREYNGGKIPEGFEVEIRDGVVHQRLTECEGTTIGGENTG